MMGEAQQQNPFNEPEPYNAMGHEPINARQTHTRFPNTTGPRFVASDGKRPGSAGNKKKGLPAVNRMKK
jgi:hypothetical protein